MTNIRSLVWKYIDSRIEIQKNLHNGLINTSSLARKIAKENKLGKNIDAIISAIRRYENLVEKKDNYKKFLNLLKLSKISTKTKLSSLLVKRNDETEKKIGKIYSKIVLRRDNILQIFQITNYIKILLDQELLKDVRKFFSKNDIADEKNDLSEIKINYNQDITKTPGVFVTLANELSLNEISLIDSIICHNEHILIVTENDLKKAFNTVINVTKQKLLKKF